jgi:hypothetical protein
VGATAHSQRNQGRHEINPRLSHRCIETLQGQ